MSMIRRNWGGVRLVDYDALAIIPRPDAEDVLLKAGTRLSDAGREWLKSVTLAYWAANDEAEHIRLAREFVDQMGVLTTVNAARISRGESVAVEPITEVPE